VTLAARTTPERAGAVVAALSASGSPPPAQGTADRARSHDTMARTTSWLHPAGPPGPAPLA
jgi:hypothetical protein